MKGTIKVAYWDTAQGNPPRLVGEIKGTPTIKFIRPAKKNKKDSNKKKTVVDYNAERKAPDMIKFAGVQQPNYVVKINSKKDLDTFATKADGYALPKVLVFSKDPSTSPVTKSLSTEFRRRLMIAEVRASKPNKDLVAKFGLEAWLSDAKAEKNVIVTLAGDGLDGEYTMMKKGEAPAKFNFKGATAYLSKIALDKPYFEHELFLTKQSADDSTAGDKTEL